VAPRVLVFRATRAVIVIQIGRKVKDGGHLESSGRRGTSTRKKKLCPGGARISERRDTREAEFSELLGLLLYTHATNGLPLLMLLLSQDV